MDSKIITLLLHVIATRGNINQLRRQNMTYWEIANLSEALIDSGLLKYEGNLLTITQDGLNFLEKNRSLIKNKDKSTWIEPDYKNKIKRIDRDFIFLPSPNELSFLK